ncbi:MAG: MFS transporter [Bdellovibrionota bacterium]|nr:MAG: MFS transporter [Bdellovibrionota bacterium]
MSVAKQSENWRDRRLRRNVWLLTLLQGVHAGFSLSFPVLVLIWEAQGMSLREVMVLQALFALSIAVCEVPSGYFADLVGRKASLLVASVAMVLAAWFYLRAGSFNEFLLAEMILGLAFAFASGADQALFFDSLKSLGREAEFQKRWGWARGVSGFSSAALLIIGGLLGSLDLRYPLIAVLLVKLIGVAFAVGLVEVRQERSMNVQRAGVAELIGLAKRCLLDSRRLRWLILYPALLLASTRLAVWLYQPYMSLSGIPIELFGVLFAAFNAVAALGAHYADRVESRFGERNVAILSLALVVVSYELLGSFVTVASFALFLTHQWARGFVQVVFNSYLNGEIDSNRRSTVISLQSMIGTVVYALGLFPVGWVVEQVSVPATLNLIGLMVLLALGLVSVLCFEGRSKGSL